MQDRKRVEKKSGERLMKREIEEDGLRPDCRSIVYDSGMHNVCV